MKKLIFLFIISSLFIMITYKYNYKKTISVLSINSLSKEENYNEYLLKYFSESNINYNYNIDYNYKNIEIENILAMINNNENKIKEHIHNSNVIIISLGNIDILTEETHTILTELNELFKDLRRINKEEIIYISPYSLKYVNGIKELCNKYHIKYIKGGSFNNNPTLLAKFLYKIIENTWNKEKY